MKPNFDGMKKLLLFLSVFALMAVSGCDRTLRDTNRGKMNVSFRVNGERYTCEAKSVHFESPMRLSFYDDNFLDFHVDVFSTADAESKGCLTFTLSDTGKIVTKKRYSLGFYNGQAEDRTAEPPVFFAEFNGYRSVSGWVNLRKIKAYKDRPGHKVISGNFEFTGRNADGQTIEITNGTFDGIY